MEEKSDIQNFYANQSIFITGGTGFIGKVLIEKLLRICFDLKMIYIMIRPKRNKTSLQRFQDIFNYPCFRNLKIENIREKVRLIEGDCIKDDFGLSQENKELLIKEVNIVIHSAADVKFDQELKQAALTNVKPVKCMLQMAREMTQLKAIVHVSTAYSFCPRTHINEEFYEPGMTSEDLFSVINSVDNEILNAITYKLLKKWPNTYTFTKGIAEDVIRNEGKSLPIAIVRPAIIMSTAEEPVVGWIDNFYGLTGVAAGILMGVIKIFIGREDNIMNCVPCDFVANNIIAAAWDLHERKAAVHSNRKELDDIPIYNYTGSNNNLQVLAEMNKTIRKLRWEIPTNVMFWFSNYITTESLLWFDIYAFFSHTLYAYIVDFLLVCFQQKPLAVRKYRKINKLLKLLAYFGTNTWQFDNSNVTALWNKMEPNDKKMFNMSMDPEHFNWGLFWKRAFKYGRVYLLNDAIETIPIARRKVKLFAILHYLFVSFLFYFLYRLILWFYSYV